MASATSVRATFRLTPDLIIMAKLLENLASCALNRIDPIIGILSCHFPHHIRPLGDLIHWIQAKGRAISSPKISQEYCTKKLEIPIRILVVSGSSTPNLPNISEKTGITQILRMIIAIVEKTGITQILRMIIAIVINEITITG